MATPITSVPGIGKATAFALSQHGFRSAEDLAVADEAVLAAVPGFGVSRAARVIESAQKSAGVPASPKDSAPVQDADAAAGGSTQSQTKEKKSKGKKAKADKKGKDKAKKKDKKKGKGNKKGKGKKKTDKK